jgi:hypothetical protein
MACNISTIGIQLSYWCLAFEVAPEFWRLPKIQHRLRVCSRKILWAREYRKRIAKVD